MKNIYITWHNEWTQLGKKFNWYTFTPVSVEFENDVHTKTWELRFILLGLGFTLVYDIDFDNSEVWQELENLTNEELEKRIDDILYESDCCGAKVGVATADEGTSHWVCKKCGEACDRKNN